MKSLHDGHEMNVFRADNVSVCPHVSIQEPVDGFCWNLAWIYCHLRLLWTTHTFPTVVYTDLMDAWSCEVVGVTLPSFNIRSWNDVWFWNFKKYTTLFWWFFVLCKINITAAWNDKENPTHPGFDCMTTMCGNSVYSGKDYTFPVLYILTCIILIINILPLHSMTFSNILNPSLITPLGTSI
jgi:hypothetical protein